MTHSTSIWDKVDFELAVSAASTQTVSPTSDEEMARRRAVTRRTIRAGDFLGGLLWIYVFLKVFVFDVDEEALRAVGADWLVDYRGLIFLGILGVLALVIRKWHLLAGLLLYILLLPLAVLVWKIPRAIYRSGSWVMFFGVFNAVSSLLTNLRYMIIFTAAGAVAAGLVLATEESATQILGAVVLTALLAASLARTLRSSLKASRFITMHRDAIKRIVRSDHVKQLTTVHDELRGGDLVKFSPEQQAAFVQNLSQGVFVHRFLYFWAFQMEQYRKSPGVVLYSAISYVMLLAELIVVTALVNLALYKIDASAFSYDGKPSIVTFLRYAISALWGNEIDALRPASDLASVVSIAAFILGVVVFVTLLLTLFVNYRQQREQTAMQEVVAEVKLEGQRLDRRLRDQYEVSARDALERLAELQAGLLGLILFFFRSYPSRVRRQRCLDCDRARG